MRVVRYTPRTSTLRRCGRPDRPQKSTHHRRWFLFADEAGLHRYQGCGSDERGGGFGVYTSDHLGPATLILRNSTIGPHGYAAVWIDGPGVFDIEGNTLSASAGVLQGSAILHGNAVFAENGVTAWDGATGLVLADDSFAGSAQIAVLLDASSATLDGNGWSGDGCDVWQQRCAAVLPLGEQEPDWDERWEICPVGNVLTAYDLAFSTLYLPTSETAE